MNFIRVDTNRPPSHPGELMAEVIEDHLKLTKVDAAKRLATSRTNLYSILNGETALSADIAVRFEAIGGGEPQLLLNMQAAYDLWHARRRQEAFLR